MNVVGRILVPLVIRVQPISRPACPNTELSKEHTNEQKNYAHTSFRNDVLNTNGAMGHTQQVSNTDSNASLNL